jgi:UDP-glucuronate 4-epimerase
MKILITGCAGFIGYHCTKRLLDRGHSIVGIDNLNNYYSTKLKLDRLAQIKDNPRFHFARIDLESNESIQDIFSRHRFDVVLHLGAQAGVRYSLEKPFSYINSNITGTLTILEGCRHHGVQHLIYASSSSVYGANTKQPFSINDRVDSPVSLYAATKKANEVMCHAYAHLYRIPMTGLRFFTVYGPWGRPDMAYFKFANAIMADEPIDVYNYGNMRRDFTYIDDIVDAIETLVESAPLATHDPVPHRVYNLGNNQPEGLLDMINLLEKALGKPAKKNLLPMQPGDVPATYADIDASTRDFGFRPKTSLADGLMKFANWYKKYQAK